MKQIVISLPDEIYLDIKYRFSTSPPRSPLGAYTVESAINDGIVLPENGKIVDMEDDVVFDLLRQYVSFGTLCDLIDEMPSVLDTKGEES